MEGDHHFPSMRPHLGEPRQAGHSSGSSTVEILQDGTWVQGRFQRRKHGTQAHHRNGHPSTWAWVTSFRTEDVAPGKRGP